MYVGNNRRACGKLLLGYYSPFQHPISFPNIRAHPQQFTRYGQVSRNHSVKLPSSPESLVAGANGHDVSFDNVTQEHAMSRVRYSGQPTNFVPTETVDDETAEAVVSLMPFVTDVVQDGKWKEVREFFSNDGTPNVPPHSPPISDASSFIVKTLLYRYHYGCYAVTRFGTNVGHGVYGSRVAI